MCPKACSNPHAAPPHRARDGHAGASRDAILSVLQQARRHRKARVLCLGDGPFTRRNMAAFLENMGITPLASRSEGRPTLLVCGRSNLNADRVNRLLRAPHSPPVLCAQEHLLYALYHGPVEGMEDLLIRVPNHPVQRWLMALGERPKGNACEAVADQAAADAFRLGDVLRVLPYVDCAIQGTQARRRKVLRQAFVMDPSALEHMASADGTDPAASWGARRSATRLHHMAASLVRARKHPGSANTPLRSICRKDLRWLRINMYDAGRFTFAWPAG